MSNSITTISLERETKQEVSRIVSENKLTRMEDTWGEVLLRLAKEYDRLKEKLETGESK